MKIIEKLYASDAPEDEPEEGGEAEEEEDEEELEDLQDTLRLTCKDAHCLKLQDTLDTCNARVNSRSQTAETCVEELMDLFHCVDHCVAKTLFSKLT